MASADDCYSGVTFLFSFFLVHYLCLCTLKVLSLSLTLPLLACLLLYFISFHFRVLFCWYLPMLPRRTSSTITTTNQKQTVRAFTAKIGKEEEEQKTHTHTQS